MGLKTRLSFREDLATDDVWAQLPDTEVNETMLFFLEMYVMPADKNGR